MDGMTTPGLASPWRPRVVAAAEARLAALLGQRRQAIPLPGLDVRITTASELPAAVLLRGEAGGEAFAIAAPDAVFNAVLASLDPAARGLRGTAAALLVELALEALLPPLEVVLGMPIRFTALEAGQVADGTAIGLRIRLGDGSLHDGALCLPDALCGRVSALLGAVRAEPLLPASVPVTVSVRIAVAELALHELRALRPGDAVIPGAFAPAGEAVAIAAERHAWRARHEAGRLLAITPRRRAVALGLEDWTMPETATVPEDAPLDELPVRLAFEIGRAEMTLAELGAVAPGHLLPLARGAEAPVDILANGRRIGRAEIVEVGGALALRVVAINGQT
jgi:type III secretion protein Q